MKGSTLALGIALTSSLLTASITFSQNDPTSDKWEDNGSDITTTASFGGKVGIGTTTPAGTLSIDSGLTDTTVYIHSNGANSNTWVLENNGASGRLVLHPSTSADIPIKFGPGDNNLFRVGIPDSSTIDIQGNLRVSRLYVIAPESDTCSSGDRLINTIASITDATAARPYLILLAPGTYEFCGLAGTYLQMKSWVDIQGSGRGITVIKGNGQESFLGTINAANNTELRDLTVEATSSNNLFAIGLTDYLNSYRVSRVSFLTHGSTNWGIRNVGSSPILEDIDITITGGSNAYGISQVSSNPVIRRVTIDISGAEASYGIFFKQSTNAEHVINDTEINVTGTSTGYGLYTYDYFDDPLALTRVDIVASTNGLMDDTYLGSDITIDHSQIRGSDHGLYRTNYPAEQTSLIVRHSEIVGSTNTILGFPSASIALSHLDGGPVNVTAPKCAGVTDETFTFFTGPACP